MDATSIQALAESGTVGSAISLIILAFAAVSAFFALIFGFKRGFSRSIVRIITMAIAAVGAFLVAANIGTYVASAFKDADLVEMVKSFESSAGKIIEDPAYYDLIGSFDASTVAIIVSLVISLIVVPIVFVAIFYAFKLLTLLVFWIVSAMLGFTRRRKNILSRFLGIIIAFVQGAIIVGVFTLPIAGFASLADEITANVIKSTDDEEIVDAVQELRAEVLDEVLENPIVNVILDAGGKDLFKTMTSVNFEEEKICAYDEVIELSDIYADVYDLVATDWTTPTKEDKANLDKIGDKLSDNYFTSTVISGVLRGIATAVDNDVLLLTTEEPFTSVLESAISVFSTSSRENLHGDMQTLIEVYYILGENGVLNSFDDADELRNALLKKHGEGEDEKTVIDCLIDELYKNPRTAHMVNALTEISIKVMCESMGLDEDAQEIYENVKVGVKDVLAINSADYETKDEYVAAVSVSLDETLKENNIEVDEATLNNMSTYIADNFADLKKEDITDEEINKAILSYYNAYAEANPDTDIDINDYLQ